jgi:hypothetical protein
MTSTTKTKPLDDALDLERMRHDALIGVADPADTLSLVARVQHLQARTAVWTERCEAELTRIGADVERHLANLETIAATTPLEAAKSLLELRALAVRLARALLTVDEGHGHGVQAALDGVPADLLEHARAVRS